MINGWWWMPVRVGAKERENNDRKISSNRNGWNAHASHINDIGVWGMNEVITKEMVEDGYVPEVIFDKLEEYKTAIEWMETFKYLFKQFCEENGVKSWETDYFKMTYIGDCQAERIDTKKMRETKIFVMNGESGEVEEVNAYEFFLKDCVVKAHVTYKEKK